MKVLLLNQCFWPDVVATAQQLTSVARALVERGHKVTVMTGRRGYDDQALRFPRREVWNGIGIIRVPSISLGKRSPWRRALNFASFSLAAAFRLLLLERQDTVIAMTSPPLISWLGSLFIRVKGGRMIFWVMDLNPDEAIAAGWLDQNSVIAKVLAALSKSSMQHAEKIIVLDRFMKERIAAKGIPEHKIEVIPPSRDLTVAYDEAGREAFRRRHGLSEKFVVMYAGNHSPCHPLRTLLEAAKQLQESSYASDRGHPVRLSSQREPPSKLSSRKSERAASTDGEDVRDPAAALKPRPDIIFAFVGGGSELSTVKDFVRSNQLKNIRCLPYQPQSDLPALLSAADLHLVIMGEAFPGIVHPCKIYNIMAAGSPFLYLGPKESHVADIISSLPDQQQASWAQAGEVDGVVKAISERAESFFSNRDRANRFPNPFKPTLPQLITQIESLSSIAAESDRVAKSRVRSPTVREGLVTKQALPDGRASDTRT